MGLSACIVPVALLDYLVLVLAASAFGGRGEGNGTSGGGIMQSRTRAAPGSSRQRTDCRHHKPGMRALPGSK
jgi:hypothetical protein